MWQKIKCWLGLKPKPHNYLIVYKAMKKDGYVLTGNFITPRINCSRQTILDMQEALQFKYDAQCVHIINVVRIDND